MNSLSAKIKNQKGQGLVEYALILALVGLVVIAVLVILGPSIGNVFGRVNSSVSTTGSINAGTIGGTASTPVTSTPVVTNLPDGAMCTANSQCNPGTCTNGHCVGVPNFGVCANNGQCASNHCVNKVCRP